MLKSTFGLLELQFTFGPEVLFLDSPPSADAKRRGRLPTGNLPPSIPPPSIPPTHARRLNGPRNAEAAPAHPTSAGERPPHRRTGGVDPAVPQL
ncbi:hypothetical protein CMUS01_02475 [Colletotrichum musicola]|uniref:Uncharacterized protein n=1 Tax=Colletotrichum musicola TaxID=2175873 RepID=A0A8H6U732_9PEZI|nr:hypothetical protein CMUS01_02475 [Colletotrichum musicola]